MDYRELENMTVIRLREEAKKFPDLKGITGMKKEELIQALVEHLGITVPEKKERKGARTPASKPSLKKKIAELRTAENAARAEKDRKKVDLLRRRIHSIKHRLRRLP
jgi:cell division protein FtsX